MSAVTVIGTKIKISYSYDTITIYPKDDADPDIHDRCRDAQIQIISIIFGVPQQMARMIIGPGPSKELRTCLRSMEQKATYDRPVHRDDPDHALYHQDNINIDENHYHVKYKKPFNRKELELALTQLVTENLISADEYREFFNEYDKRQEKAFTGFLNALSGDVTADTKAIVKCITQIKDNDLLAALHDYLLSDDRFCHVMKRMISEYRGIALDGSMITVSKDWADIEKAISLQMVANLRAITTMETRMRLERANQFQSCHPFFGIKRTTKHAASSVNKIVLNLVDGDGSRLDTQYNKHMKKF